MKKASLIMAMCLVFALSSVAFSSPVVDLNADQSVAGFTHSKAELSESVVGVGSGTHPDKATNVGLYFEHNFGSMVAGIEHQNYSHSAGDLSYTDVYGKYPIGKGVNLIGGLRHIDLDNWVSDSYFLYGVSANTKLSDKLSLYATYSKADILTTYDIGVNFDMTENTVLNLGYHSIKAEDDGTKIELKGPIIGVAFKF